MASNSLGRCGLGRGGALWVLEEDVLESDRAESQENTEQETAMDTNKHNK